MATEEVVDLGAELDLQIVDRSAELLVDVEIGFIEGRCAAGVAGGVAEGAEDVACCGGMITAVAVNVGFRTRLRIIPIARPPTVISITRRLVFARTTSTARRSMRLSITVGCKVCASAAFGS